jgi:ribosomal protection tetracycline resistance protein
MLYDRFNIDAVLTNPVVIHKEVPTQVGQGEAYYTRVSGVKLEIKPLPSGSGLVYQSKLSTDFLHKKYQRQTERLVLQYAKQGLYGWEITDAEINLLDGKFDSMGSEPKHFNIAVPLALIRALKQASMKIFEPISSYTIITPKQTLSLVLQHLYNRNGTAVIKQDDDEFVTVTGEATLESMHDFPVELGIISSGRGIYTFQVQKYKLSSNQSIECEHIGPDPRNEVTFIISDMKASLDYLDPVMSKKKKVSRSKFKRERREREMRQLKKGRNVND